VSYIITLNKTSMLIQLDKCGCKYAIKVLNYVANATAGNSLVISMLVVVESLLLLLLLCPNADLSALIGRLPLGPKGQWAS
jgi:hypothetical protein